MHTRNQSIIASISASILTIILAATFHTKPAPPKIEKYPLMPPIEALSPQETLKTMQLPEGYHLELVLAEPYIKEPVAAAFDANGRMFVAEMRTYMQDIDGIREHDPNSQISLHWSSKNNGNFDRHSVFIDNLVLPRMILPLKEGQLLVNETNSQDIILYEDTDKDGVADKKTLWYEGGPRGGNLEHQQSGLIWSLDNWIYTTYNLWRLRWQPVGAPPIKEPIAANGGQWGLTQDDFGKPWMVNASRDIGPLNFQTHILYGGFNLKTQVSEDYATVWPLVGIADVQGGPYRYRPEDKTLNHFTSTCGAEVFRGDRLPPDLKGDLLFSESVGRLIRRTKIEVKDGLTYLKNAYDKSEFLRSTDPLSRIVNMNTAPDGTLFLIDMYRGIIQEASWVKPTSYLRKVIEQYALDKQIARGRIWRLVHNDFTPGPQPKLYAATPTELVATLDHPNGWWRDTAQKLIILNQDNSVIPALNKLVTEAKNPLTRIHALWTLEGLNAADATLLRKQMKDPDPNVSASAIRISETLYKNGDTSFFTDIVALTENPNATVALQALCSAQRLDFDKTKDLVQASLKETNKHIALREIAIQMLAPTPKWGKEFNNEQKGLLNTGHTIFNELCFNCHNPDGKGTPINGNPEITIAPPLAGSTTVTGPEERLIAVLLKGITGPINSKTYDTQMIPMETNDDYWIASVASYIRNSFGNKAETVSPTKVGLLRSKLKTKNKEFTIKELENLWPE
jgi:mono/diheme cytochrome c family protein/glucose/arabinose dehydrogenase